MSPWADAAGCSTLGHMRRNFLTVPGRTLLVFFALHAGVACAQPAPSAQDTLFLTWHGDPTTTMVVQWLELGALPPALPDTSADASFATPRLPGPITLDGRGDDWGVHGLRLDYLAQPDGQWPDPTGFLATAKLGWTADGLAVLVHVIDDEATEADDPDKLWSCDSVELFLGDGLGQPRAVQFIVSPGVDPKHPALRTSAYALAEEGMPEDVAVHAVATKTDDGYTVEALVPWDNLGARPKAGDTFAFQLIVNDRDDVFAREQLAWYPAVDSYKDRRAMQTLRLIGTSESLDTSVRALAQPRFDAELDRLVIDLGGEPRLIGETVAVRSGDRKLATVELEDVLGFAGAVAVLPLGEGGAVQRFDAVSVHLDDRVVARNLFGDTLWRTTPAAVQVERISDDRPDPVTLTTEAVPFGRTGWFVQRLAMAGLTPDTEYLLEVPGHDEPVLFRTAPATLDQPLAFAEGGDVGTSSVVGELHDQAAAWDPLFGLVGGDCAYGNGVDPEAWRRFLKLWHDHMLAPDGRTIPMLCAIGNHEVEGSYGRPKANAPFFYALFGPLYPNRGTYQTLDFGEYLTLFLLDSGHTAKHGGQQTKWLAAALEDRPDVPHRFAVYHVPAYPSHRPFEGPYSIPAREHWVPLFEQHRISAAFEHHDHTYKRTHPLIHGEPHPDGVLYLGDGAWGRTPRTVNSELPYLAVAKSTRNVIRVTIDPSGTQKYLAVDENGLVLDKYPAEAE